MARASPPCPVGPVSPVAGWGQQPPATVGLPAREEADPLPASGEAIKLCGCHWRFLPVIKAFNEETYGNGPRPQAGILPGVGLLTAANYTVLRCIQLRRAASLGPPLSSGIGCECC